jgi:peptide chain release factor subunit 1
MISREQLRQLAEFQCDDNGAITFYFQPAVPADKSHRQESILVRDIVRQALQPFEKNGKKGPSRNDVEHILQLADHMNGNRSRGKAVFLCESKGVRQEFDLPARLPRTQVLVNRRFHLKPLAALVDAPRCTVVLMDRKRARIFELWIDEIKEVEDIRDDLPRVGRSDGFGGYEAGHIERHVENEAMRHFKFVCDRLVERHNAGLFEALIFGCRDDVWGEAKAYLHSYLTNAMIGRFSADVVSLSPENVREEADRILNEHRINRQQLVLHEALGQANRDSRGAVGLRDVLDSLEKREVQTLVLGEKLNAPGVECTNCGHVDTRTTPDCAVCGQKNREVEDLSDAIVSLALRNGADIVYVANDPALDRNEHIAALLRFRADQNTPAKIAS